MRDPTHRLEAPWDSRVALCYASRIQFGSVVVAQPGQWHSQLGA
jgi:hypothetical protein